MLKYRSFAFLLRKPRKILRITHTYDFLGFFPICSTSCSCSLANFFPSFTRVCRAKSAAIKLVLIAAADFSDPLVPFCAGVLL
jgi:hypothetical protein